MAILVTGALGYIGSHMCAELKGHKLILLDNLSNSNESVLAELEKLNQCKLEFWNDDILEPDALANIFARNDIELVIHFASLKAVSKSVTEPLAYYFNNVTGTINLLNIMKQYNCKRLIFSSSATVYGSGSGEPFIETDITGTGISCPYGRTKHMVETILKDLQASDPSWSITLLRYFNPIGSRPQLPETPKGEPNNLMPHIIKAARGGCLTVFGNTYDTPDGTCIRDYIHVRDVALAHLSCINLASGLWVYNIGTGFGTSVFDLIKTFEQVNGVKVPFVIGSKRAGDIAIITANVDKIGEELQWTPKYNLKDMCKIKF